MFIKQTSELDEHGKSASITIKRLFIGSETDSLIFPLEVFHRSDIIYDTTLANPFALIINLPSSAIVKILFWKLSQKDNGWSSMPIFQREFQMGLSEESPPSGGSSRLPTNQ